MLVSEFRVDFSTSFLTQFRNSLIALPRVLFGPKTCQVNSISHHRCLFLEFLIEVGCWPCVARELIEMFLLDNFESFPSDEPKYDFI